eukprot:TRINITY_DN1304_c0_g1::TRINITY_DN1304_c0_g1_i1::g.20095::m.20095 TRINITY_DN1304_c0_g1::TRINITY_DN1304_c0_g1_i1::g.20095  ORF type:complete len:171 (+),score=24.08,sp/Q8T2T5/C560_DICDI/34.11/8e-16,Sdh_cyt/PF01127.17/7.5e-19 TRINITY_DN1304_c0_g1_i1:41-553(+)
MSMILRSSSTALQSLKAQRVQSLQLTRSVSSYTDRMDKTGRPISPHAQIYNFPLNARASIVTRVTGLGLTGGVYAVGLASLVTDVPALAAAIESPLLLLPLKFLVAFPLAFHTLSGLRHLYWDKKPETITLKQTGQTSKLLFGSAIALGLVGTFATGCDQKKCEKGTCKK